MSLNVFEQHCGLGEFKEIFIKRSGSQSKFWGYKGKLKDL